MVEGENRRSFGAAIVTPVARARTDIARIPHYVYAIPPLNHGKNSNINKKNSRCLLLFVNKNLSLLFPQETRLTSEKSFNEQLSSFRYYLFLTRVVHILRDALAIRLSGRQPFYYLLSIQIGETKDGQPQVL